MNELNLPEALVSEKTIISEINSDRIEILRFLDQFFTINDIKYFAFSSLLVSCEYYHDLCTDGKLRGIQIGMLRDDFERAEQLLNSTQIDERYEIRAGLDEIGVHYRTIKIGREYLYFKWKKGKAKSYNTFHGVEICPFDSIPDEYRSARFHFRKMRVLNAIYYRVAKSWTKKKNNKGLSLKEHLWEIVPYEKCFRTLLKNAMRFKGVSRTFARVVPKKSRIIRYQQLYPLRRCAFRDFSLSVPNDISVWCPVKAAYADYLVSEKVIVAEINNDRAAILKTLDNIFREHGIKYFAFSNLLVFGEYYHDFFEDGKIQGIQIGMVRDDFERAEKLLLSEMQFDERYEVRLGEDVNGVHRRTIQIGRQYVYLKWNKKGKASSRVRFHGVEICAFDYVPDEFEFARFHFVKMRLLNAVYHRVATSWTKRKSGKRRNLKERFWGLLPCQWCYNLLRKNATYFNGRTNNLARVIPNKSTIITYDQIFPLHRCGFRDFSLSVPNDISVWCPVMTPELEKRTKHIQEISLGILKKIDEVCGKLGIGYFICGGSMLGAMRHGGFIPWDDDIDIGMLRADYDVFLREGQKLLGDDLFLQTRETDPQIPYLFSKVRANNTSYITNYNVYRNFHKGICVDIFPFDNIPNDPASQTKLRKRVRFWEKIHNKAVNRQLPKEYFAVTRTLTFREKLVHALDLVHRAFFCCIPLQLTQKLYLQAAQRYNNKADLEYVASFVPTYTYIKREDLLPYKRMNFAGFQASMPNKPEVFLEMQYGDYMAMPPEHKRVGHDLIDGIIDTDGVVKADTPTKETEG